jgi:hypothetical protein
MESVERVPSARAWRRTSTTALESETRRGLGRDPIRKASRLGKPEPDEVGGGEKSMAAYQTTLASEIVVLKREWHEFVAK